jgi:UDP-N-acetylglucosamine 1-carboxyvinyltransferase
LGAEINLEGGYVEAKCNTLRGDKIYLDLATVTGTMNIMMAATLAKGITIIDNAAREPEVIDLANSLIKRGARIEGAGTSVITIEGVKHLGPLEYSIMADRIEAGTYLTAVAMTGGKLRLEGIDPQYLQAVIDKLIETGAKIDCRHETLTHGAESVIELYAPSRPKAVDVETQTFPGFATDMQAQFMALLCIADGNSAVTENIFENRFMHVSEMQRMGAKLKIKGNTVFIEGVEELQGAPTMATDLRASAGLILAALVAKGTSEVRRIYHLDRGYEQMDLKLSQLGAKIRRSQQ